MRAALLREEYADRDVERAVLATVARDVELVEDYKELRDELFAYELGTWRELCRAIMDGMPVPSICRDWDAIEETAFPAALDRLADLAKRRILADEIERTATRLRSEEDPARIAADLSEMAAAVRPGFEELTAGATWGDAALTATLAAFADRARQYETSGVPVMGLRTGITPLDNTLNGLNPGLHLLGAGPSVGKTTSATHISLNVAAVERVPVVYVSFEDQPDDLTRRLIAAAADVDQLEIIKGTANSVRIAEAARSIQEALSRILIVRGTARLTIGEVRLLARRAMRRFRTDRCLIVADYLQTWAKRSAELRTVGDTRAKVEVLAGELADMATSLGVPVIAITALNRGSNYGNPGGKSAEQSAKNKAEKDAERLPSLEWLKESGDLEYAADVVLVMVKGKRATVPGIRPVDLYVLKNRRGGTDEVIPLDFTPSRARFDVSPVAKGGR